MKKIVFVAALLNNLLCCGQDIAFEKDFFKNKLANFSNDFNHFSQSQVGRSIEQNQVREIAVSMIVLSKFASTYSPQTINFRMKKIPYAMNHDEDFMQCGPFQPRNSQDMMIRAIKSYLFNKYILGLFLPTPYDD